MTWLTSGRIQDNGSVLNKNAYAGIHDLAGLDELEFVFLDIVGLSQSSLHMMDACRCNLTGKTRFGPLFRDYGLAVHILQREFIQKFLRDIFRCTVRTAPYCSGNDDNRQIFQDLKHTEDKYKQI